MGRTGEATVHIAASPDKLWAMVADVTRMGEWSPETVSCEWLDGATGPVPGARFKGRNRRGRSKWSTTCEVIACQPGREFAFAVGSAGRPTTRWRYSFTPAGTGTDVTESFELVKPLSRFDRILTRVTTGVKDREADMLEGVRQTLERLKRAAEPAEEGT